jgi:DNA polymerase II
MSNTNILIKRGIIVNSQYSLVNDKPIITIFGRLEDNKSFKANFEFYPYFYIKKSDIEKAQKIIKLNVEETKLKNFENEEVTKIILNTPKEAPVLRKFFEDGSIVCYESDIPFTRRFLIDNYIQATIEITGEFVKDEENEKVDFVVLNPKIKPVAHNVLKNNLTLLSIDIETTADASKILAISFYGNKIKKVFVVKNKSFEKIVPEFCTVFDTEKELLMAFFEEVQKYDPDVITGWSFIDFDLKVIQERAKHHKISFNIGRDEKDSTLRLESSFLKDSKANANGRIVLDGISLLKSSFVDLENYKLNTAAKVILGKEKISTLDDRTEFIQNSYENNPEVFVEYNLTDSILVYEILEKSKVFDLTIQRSILTGMEMDSVSASIASFDCVYLPKLHQIGFVANSVYISESDEGLGGFVLKSQPGIYDNIIVLDFKSLYPSIIRTFNIDPKEFILQNDELKYDLKNERDKLKINDKNKIDKKYLDKHKYIISPNGSIFTRNIGILPDLIENYWKERDIAKKNKNDLASYAIKILMNSMYGVLASPKSRYFNRNVSNSITFFAQFFIQKVISKIEEYGYDVIYGDTDSTFVNTNTKNTDEAVKIGKKIEKDINKFLEEYILENYNLKSVLELQFEKTFIKFFMPTVRGSEAGAKKRYAGLKLLEDGKTKLDFTGLEFVRKDWTLVSKEFQLGLLDLVFKDKPVDKFIIDFVKDLEKGKYDDKLIYRKSLSKPIESYTKTTPPHVKAAKLLDNVTSRVIEYVITENGPEPIEKQKSKLDYKHYIDKQIKPIADSVLQLLGKNFDDLMKGNNQTGLGKFF